MRALRHSSHLSTLRSELGDAAYCDFSARDQAVQVSFSDILAQLIANSILVPRLVAGNEDSPQIQALRATGESWSTTFLQATVLIPDIICSIRKWLRLYQVF